MAEKQFRMDLYYLCAPQNVLPTLRQWGVTERKLPGLVEYDVCHAGIVDEDVNVAEVFQSARYQMAARIVTRDVTGHPQRIRPAHRGELFSIAGNQRKPRPASLERARARRPDA